MPIDSLSRAATEMKKRSNALYIIDLCAKTVIAFIFVIYLFIYSLWRLPGRICAQMFCLSWQGLDAEANMHENARYVCRVGTRLSSKQAFCLDLQGLAMQQRRFPRSRKLVLEDISCMKGSLLPSSARFSGKCLIP
jgi:hypothetical protein